MEQNECIRTVREMINAPSCCQDLKDAGQKYLSAVGSEGEKAAFGALLQEIRQDVCTLDHTILFFESEKAVQIFGPDKAKAMAAHARERKERGEKWCDCPACAAGLKILESAG